MNRGSVVLGVKLRGAAGALIQSVRCGESAGRRRTDAKEGAGRCGMDRKVAGGGTLSRINRGSVRGYSRSDAARVQDKESRWMREGSSGSVRCGSEGRGRWKVERSRMNRGSVRGYSRSDAARVQDGEEQMRRK